MNRYALIVSNEVSTRTISRAVDEFVILNNAELNRDNVEYYLQTIDNVGIEAILHAEGKRLKRDVKFFDDYSELLRYADYRSKKRIITDSGLQYQSIKKGSLRFLPPTIVERLSYADMLKGIPTFALFRFYDEDEPLLFGEALRIQRRKLIHNRLHLSPVIHSDGYIPIKSINDRMMLYSESVDHHITNDLRINLKPKDFENTEFDVLCSRPTLIVNADCKRFLCDDPDAYVEYRGNKTRYGNYMRTYLLKSVDEIIETYFVANEIRMHLFKLVKCGHCLPCLNTKRSLFNVDVSHELIYQNIVYKKPCQLFLSLTYDDEYIGNNELDSSHFHTFVQNLRKYFALTRRNKLEELDVVLNQFDHDAFIRNHPNLPNVARIADTRYPLKPVHISKNSGRMSNLFRDHEDILTDGIWHHEDFLPKYFNIVGCGEYGSAHGRRHFHACVVGIPEFLFDIRMTANFTSINKGDYAPSDELLGLLQYFWPYGHVEAVGCYGEVSNVAHYISKYISKQTGIYGHEVPPSLYTPRRPFGKLFLPIHVRQYSLRHGLRFDSLTNQRPCGIFVKGHWTTYSAPTSSVLNSAEPTPSSFLPNSMRKYVVACYNHAISTDSANSNSMYEQIYHFLKGRSPFIKKLFTDSGDSFDSFTGFIHNPVYSKYGENTKYEYNQRFLSQIHTNPTARILVETENPFFADSLFDVLARLDSILGSPSPYCVGKTNEQYFDDYYYLRSTISRPIPEPSSVRIDRFVRKSNKRLADMQARCISDHQ